MRNNRRLVLAWIIAMGLVGLGVLADLYLVYVWSVQPVVADLKVGGYPISGADATVGVPYRKRPDDTSGCYRDIRDVSSFFSFSVVTG